MTELEQIEQIRQTHAKPGMTAGEFAELLPEHLRAAYWRAKLGEYCQQQGIDPNSCGDES